MSKDNYVKGNHVFSNTVALLFSRKKLLLVAILLSVSFACISSYFSRSILQSVPHLEDEYSYLYQARIFAMGKISFDTPKLQYESWQPFLIDYKPTGKRFSKYTPGWPLLLTLGVILDSPYCVNLILGVLNIFLTAILGSKLFSDRIGVIAASLVAFSPMFLILGGTLMPHQLSLLLVNVSLLSALRQDSTKLHWSPNAYSGLAFGLLIITRPLSGLALAVPLVIVTLARGLKTVVKSESRINILSCTLCALVLSLLLPIYNWILTDQLRLSLYDLYWDFDVYGFGERLNSTSHTLEAAWRNISLDLSLASSDLLGWQLQPVNDAMKTFFLNGSGLYPGHGLSLYLIIAGLSTTFLYNVTFPLLQYSKFIITLVVLTALWLLIPYSLWDLPFAKSPEFAWAWLFIGALLLYTPLIILRRNTIYIDDKLATYLLWTIAISAVCFNLPYWIGAQRLSVRYFSEGLTAAALLAALAINFLFNTLAKSSKHIARSSIQIVILVGLFTLATTYSLFNYTLPRLESLRGLYGIDREILDVALNYQQSFGNTLVLMKFVPLNSEAANWTRIAPLLSVTSPDLKSPLTAILDLKGTNSSYLSTFSDRKIVRVEFNNERFLYIQEEKI